jgi:hypothetical protein
MTKHSEGDAARVPLSYDEELRERAQKQLKAKAAFRQGVMNYVAVNAFLVVLWAVTGRGSFWPIWPILGWGIGLGFQAMALNKRDSGPSAAQVQAEVDRLRQKDVSMGRGPASEAPTSRPVPGTVRRPRKTRTDLDARDRRSSRKRAAYPMVCRPLAFRASQPSAAGPGLGGLAGVRKLVERMPAGLRRHRVDQVVGDGPLGTRRRAGHASRAGGSVIGALLRGPGAQVHLRHEQEDERPAAQTMAPREEDEVHRCREADLEGVRQPRVEALMTDEVGQDVAESRGVLRGQRSDEHCLFVRVGQQAGSLSAATKDESFAAATKAFLPLSLTLLNSTDRNTATPSVPPIWRKKVAALVAIPMSRGSTTACTAGERLHGVTEPGRRGTSTP